MIPYCLAVDLVVPRFLDVGCIAKGRDVYMYHPVKVVHSEGVPQFVYGPIPQGFFRA